MINSKQGRRQMFRSLSICGFRGFQDLRVDDLDRFSLFLGPNNVGKTAVLEAIFLMAGPTNPDLPLRVNAFRGIEQFPLEQLGVRPA
jgi:AAA15 family ATPase/GTPase